MKKRILVALLALFTALASVNAQSNSPGAVAVGPIYSLSLFDFIQSPLQGAGFTGKIPGLAPIFGANFYFSAAESRYFLGVTADWILYRQPLYSPFNLNFYLGPGFYTSLQFDGVNDAEKAKLSAPELKTARTSQVNRLDAGLRIPAGVNWTPTRFLEVFVELTPAFGISFKDPVAPGWLLQSAAGLRIWF